METGKCDFHELFDLSDCKLTIWQLKDIVYISNNLLESLLLNSLKITFLLNYLGQLITINLKWLPFWRVHIFKIEWLTQKHQVLVSQLEYYTKGVHTVFINIKWLTWFCQICIFSIWRLVHYLHHAQFRPVLIFEPQAKMFISQNFYKQAMILLWKYFLVITNIFEFDKIDDVILAAILGF